MTDQSVATKGLDDLWARFKAHADPAAREGLIIHFSSLVKFVAGRVGFGLPKSVDHNDLVSY
jgi:RNA polymerase sigma factor for flagellar operon FliA